MGTSFSEIIKRAKVSFNDYKLDSLYETDPDFVYEYLSNFLIRASSNFYGCLQSLDYTTETDTEGNSEYTYVNDLTSMEKNILSDLLVLEWWNNNLQDITQVNVLFTGRDKKRDSVSSNLKEKSEYKDRLIEHLSLSINQYQIANFDNIFDS